MPNSILHNKQSRGRHAPKIWAATEAETDRERGREISDVSLE